MRVAIPVNLADLQEARPVPGGHKYDLTIASVEEQTSKNNLPQLKVSIGIDGHDDSPNVTHFISLPSPGDDKSQAKAIFLARFLELFDIPYTEDGFDTDDFFGAKAKAELTLSEPDDNGNTYNRLVLPRLDRDAGEARRSPAPPPLAEAKR